MKGEIWKRIDGHDNSFEISSCGKVRSLDRMVKYSDGRERFYAGRELRLQADKRGYMTVDIFKDGKRKNEKVHRLVAKSFVDGFSEIKNTVNHVDGDKKNNSYENLEWCSAKENAKHANRARKRVRLIYATGWRFIHNVGNNWYVGYTNELEDADLEKFDYEYLGYCDRNELERVIG